MKARVTGIALVAALVSAGWTLTFAQGGAPQLPPAGGAGAAQRGGGAGAGAGGAAPAGGGGQRGGGGGGGQRGGAAAAPAQPAPRWPDGKIMLSPGPGAQKGLWHGAFNITATNVPSNVAQSCSPRPTSTTRAAGGRASISRSTPTRSASSRIARTA